MTQLGVVLDATDGSLAEKIKGYEVIEVKDGVTLLGIPEGMQSGRPSVAFLIDLPDGRKVFAETSLMALILGVEALQAKYKEALDGEISAKPSSPLN